jgi:hypothetical protein
MLLDRMLAAGRSFEAARDYPPNQVYLGNARPDDLWTMERPWWRDPSPGPRVGRWGEIMPQEEFFGVMSLCDGFRLLLLEDTFAEKIRSALRDHPLFETAELEGIEGTSAHELDVALDAGRGIPLFVNGHELVGACLAGYEDDPSQEAAILLENLAAKASAVLATRHLLHLHGVPPAETVDYVLAAGEEAVGDRYQRGAGNLAKAIAERSWCENATGSDVKAFCCAPAHAVTMAAGLVQAGLFEHVLVVGGGSLAKLGMKSRGHLAKGVPVLEDVLGAFAFSIGADDGISPTIRLDAVGLHKVKSGSQNQAIMTDLVVEPLRRVGLRITDVDKFGTELHDPEVTEPAGSGNVPRVNYRMIGALAVLAGELSRGDLDDFERSRGMPGFAPTQGHIAAAVPFLGHARAGICEGTWRRVMFVAKGSLFLGKMTTMSDGVSFMIEGR